MYSKIVTLPIISHPCPPNVGLCLLASGSHIGLYLHDDFGNPPTWGKINPRYINTSKVVKAAPFQLLGKSLMGIKVEFIDIVVTMRDDNSK